ncbi:MAG: hypothetical protein U0414_05140 [Polyangiaceae bacterium]
MKIAKLECVHFAGVPDGSYSFLAPSRAPNVLTLIAGVRASGKTRLLEAVVALKELVGAYLSPPLGMLERGHVSGSLGGTFVLTDEERDAAELDSNELSITFPLGDDGEPVNVKRPVRTLFERFALGEASWKIEYFPAGRVLPPFGEVTTPDEERIARFSSTPNKYAGLIPALLQLSTADGAKALEETATRGMLLGLDAPDSLARFRAALAKLVPELRLRGAQPGPDGRPMLAFERANGSMVGAQQLSEAQKQALLLAGTIVRLGLSRSIILLDGPELHVHVADQARFLEALVSIGDDNQWIVATGSSEIMKAARRDQMIALPSPREPARA